MSSMKRAGMNYRDRIPNGSARSALFGGAGYDRVPKEDENSGEMLSERASTMYEQQNDALVGDLANKVSMLKSLTININDEVREHNKMLDEMQDDFGGVGGLLKGSMNRLSGLMKAGHNKHMCYLILFVVFVFFVIYYIVRR
eukprot:Opistho-2@28717